MRRWNEALYLVYWSYLGVGKPERSEMWIGGLLCRIVVVVTGGVFDYQSPALVLVLTVREVYRISNSS